MSTEQITFPSHPTEYVDVTRDAVVFPGIVDGQPVRFLITFERLQVEFGMYKRGEEALEEFRKNRPVIERIASTMAHNGHIVDGEILIHS